MAQGIVVVLILALVIPTWSEEEELLHPPCRWSNHFMTCQANIHFLEAQPIPTQLDPLLQIIRDNNACVRDGCSEDKCMFSDVYGHCVSTMARWLTEMRIPFFAVMFRRECSVYADQKMLGSYSPCLGITEEGECAKKKYASYCDWQTVNEKNSTTPIGTNPCQHARNLCFPKMQISSCAHCWMRGLDCFYDCEPYRAYLEGLQVDETCWKQYNTDDFAEDCDADPACWWNAGFERCEARLSAWERGMEPSCLLKILFDVDHRRLNNKCMGNVELKCIDEPDCEWYRGPITLNGFCPMRGIWQEIGSMGECRVSDKQEARRVLGNRTADAYGFIMDTVRRCEESRTKKECEASEGWSNFPEWKSETFSDPENYLIIGIIVVSSVVIGMLATVLLYRAGRRLYYFDPDVLLKNRWFGDLYATKVKPSKGAPEWTLCANTKANRPIDCACVSGTLHNFVTASKLQAPGEVISIDFQPHKLEPKEIERMVQIPQKGLFVTALETGKWSICENVLRLVFDEGTRETHLIASPKQGEDVWFGQERVFMKIVKPKPLPRWFAPVVLSTRYEVEEPEEGNFECVVCNFDLFVAKIGIMKKNSKRCCSHYLHEDCAKALLKKMKLLNLDGMCPICGAFFAEVRVLPDLLLDPKGWFSVVDVDLSGTLDPREVEAAIGSCLPLDRGKIRDAIADLWITWDPNFDGDIDFSEFMAPGGLREYVMANVMNLCKEDFITQDTETPDLGTHPFEWFQSWDQDGSGTLERGEMLRALIRTFCVTRTGAPILAMAREMRSLGEDIWADLGYDPEDALDFPTFMKPYGLADTFLHNEVNCRFFGESQED